MNFWMHHGWLFLLGLTVFPRLTMLFAVTTPFGVIAWLGWFIWPSLLVAILATMAYSATNPLLVACAWLIVFGKTGTVKRTIRETATP